MENRKDIIEQYYIIYSDIVEKIEHKKYGYTSIEGYMQMLVEGLNEGDIRNVQKIYWQEILLRTHFAAVTSLIRSKKWLSGVVLGIETNNLLTFSASLRGFLESIVDSYYSLESFPTSLALNFKRINLALKGDLNKIFVCEELENKLIHFQFAKKGKKGVDAKVNIALHNAEYINSFDLENIGIKNLYSELCEVTHPAANSIKCFTQEKTISENYSYIVTSTETDCEIISEIISQYSQQIKSLLSIGVTLPYVCLKILALFDFEDIHSEYINDNVFDNVLLNKHGWNNILEMIDKGEKYLDDHNLKKIIYY